MEFFATYEPGANGDVSDVNTRQAMVVQLLDRRPLASEYARRLQAVVGTRRMLRVSLVLCKQAGDMSGALDCYVRDPDPAHQALVFDYIDDILGHESLAVSPDSHGGSFSAPSISAEALAMKGHIMDKLSDLLMIDQEKVIVLFCVGLSWL